MFTEERTGIAPAVESPRQGGTKLAEVAEERYDHEDGAQQILDDPKSFDKDNMYRQADQANEHEKFERATGGSDV